MYKFKNDKSISAKIKPAPTKEMTAAEIVELKKLLDCPFYRRAFKGVR